MREKSLLLSLNNLSHFHLNNRKWLKKEIMGAQYGHDSMSCHGALKLIESNTADTVNIANRFENYSYKQIKCKWKCNKRENKLKEYLVLPMMS